MLTNFKTISASIKRLREVEERVAAQETGLTKREILELSRDHDKLERALGGIKDMGGLPDILVVIDTNKEAIAVAEANKLRIPVVAVLDSNSSPDGIAYPIPGNDDAMRAIHLYCDLFADAVLDGLQAELAASGVDIGARAVLAAQPIAADDAVEPEMADAAPEPTMADAAPEPTMAEAAEIEPPIDEAADAAANEIEGAAPEARA
jgi:small subunit ribosomal protein S2